MHKTKKIIIALHDFIETIITLTFSITSVAFLLSVFGFSLYGLLFLIPVAALTTYGVLVMLSVYFIELLILIYFIGEVITLHETIK